MSITKFHGRGIEGTYLTSANYVFTRREGRPRWSLAMQVGYLAPELGSWRSVSSCQCDACSKKTWNCVSDFPARVPRSHLSIVVLCKQQERRDGNGDERGRERLNWVRSETACVANEEVLAGDEAQFWGGGGGSIWYGSAAVCHLL